MSHTINRRDPSRLPAGYSLELSYKDDGVLAFVQLFDGDDEFVSDHGTLEEAAEAAWEHAPTGGTVGDTAAPLQVDAAPSEDRQGIADAVLVLASAALQDTIQSVHCRDVLLALYNSYYYPLNLTTMRALNETLKDKATFLIAAFPTLQHEIHLYVDGGGELFDKLSKQAISAGRPS